MLLAHSPSEHMSKPIRTNLNHEIAYSDATLSTSPLQNYHKKKIVDSSALLITQTEEGNIRNWALQVQKKKENHLNIGSIAIGKYCVDCIYYSPFPFHFSAYNQTPPGYKVYCAPNHSVAIYCVDGKQNKLYC